MNSGRYVSVVIPVKNGGDLFAAVLSSILSQTVDFRFDVIVVDSGSTDGSVEFVTNLQSRDDRVILKRIPPEEFSHGGTRNFGASLTDSDFIAYVTQDALPANNLWLSNLIAPFAVDEGVAGVFGCHIPYPSCDPLTARDINAFMRSFEAGAHIVQLDDPERYASDVSYRQFLHFYSDNNACMRRSVWKLHPYPPVAWGEDQIWAKIIIENGFKKAFAPKAAVYHSHSYSFEEQINRSFEDRSFWLENFGYESVRSREDLYNLCLNVSSADIAWWNENIGTTSLADEKKIHLRNFARFLGEYLAHLQKQELFVGSRRVNPYA